MTLRRHQFTRRPIGISVVRHPRYLPSIPMWRHQYRQGRYIPRYIVRRRNFTQVSLVSPTPCSSLHYSNVQNFRVHAVVHKTMSMLLNARHTQLYRGKPATVYVVTCYLEPSTSSPVLLPVLLNHAVHVLSSSSSTGSRLNTASTSK